MRRKLPAALVLICVLSLSPAHAVSATGLANHRIAPRPSASVVRHGPPTRAAGCPHSGREDTPVGEQLAAMRCLVNRARQRAGHNSLADSRELDRSAGDKAADILRCKSFSHFACDREFTFWMKRVGYLSASCWRAGENLAWGAGPKGSPRAIFRSWMRSPDHRSNILGHYSQTGIGMQVGDLDGRSGIHVWTEHFGAHC